MDKIEVKFEEDIDELQNDDLAIVLRPNFKKNKWDGKVSIKTFLCLLKIFLKMKRNITHPGICFRNMFRSSEYQC